MFPLNPKHMPKSVASLISNYASSLISGYASITALGMLFRAVVKELKDLIPQWVRSYIYLKLRNYFFKPPQNDHLTLVIKQTSGIVLNEVYEKVEIYLGAKISPSDMRLELSKTNRQKTISLAIEKRRQVVKDTFDDIELQWRYKAKSNKSSKTNNSPAADDEEVKHHCGFELTFNKKHKSKVMDSYMPYVFAQDDSITQQEKKIIDDLDRFLERRELYKKVGKAWKRGYLLYGPPGTGKWKFTLSGLLNFIDGLWSCCGDERIIIFTTNHKDKLDPALTLASNYLGIHESNPHHLCGEIESLIESTEVTPVAVAEAVMKSDDADVVLEGLVKFHKEKKAADDELKKAKKADEERTKAAEEQGTNKAERPEGDEDVSTNC
ncbi:hypothetical protein ABKV19_001251 [Rosa sericea]